MRRYLLPLLAAALSICLGVTTAQAASLKVRVEHGDALQPCPPGTTVTLERNGPAVPYGPHFTIAYVGNTFVMTALHRNSVPHRHVPYGLDIYRGDVPIVSRTNPRCDPAQGGCAPDTSFAYVRWLYFPTDPALPLVISVPPVPTVQVQQECGFSFMPCGGAGVIVLERNGPAVPYGSLFTIAYVNDTFVMTALAPNEVAPGLPYGLDVYRGDVPIRLRQSPPCDPVYAPGCTPDTALAFVSWMGFPTDPAVPRVVALPPNDWGAGATD